MISLFIEQHPKRKTNERIKRTSSIVKEISLCLAFIAVLGAAASFCFLNVSGAERSQTILFKDPGKESSMVCISQLENIQHIGSGNLKCDYHSSGYHDIYSSRFLTEESVFSSISTRNFVKTGISLNIYANFNYSSNLLRHVVKINRTNEFNSFQIMWYFSYGCCDVIIKYEDMNSKLSLQYLIKPGSKKWRRR